MWILFVLNALFLIAFSIETRPFKLVNSQNQPLQTKNCKIYLHKSFLGLNCNKNFYLLVTSHI